MARNTPARLDAGSQSVSLTVVPTTDASPVPKDRRSRVTNRTARALDDWRARQAKSGDITVKVPHRAAPYHQRVRNIGGAFTDPEFEDASHLDDDDGSLNRRLPRRRQLVARAEGFETPPMRTELKFVIQRRLVLQRLWVIAIAFNRYFLSNIWYGIRQRDSEKKRAVRLRLTIERIGGSAIKIGQQMAIRVDLLPYAYTEELNKLLDKVPPFPKEYAIERLQALTGKPLEETFQAIDLDNPIGAASVSCVYQAVLLNGDRVAIKIRRPGIGKQFTADIHAMRWAAWLLETLTILRTGMAKNVIEEFGDMLLDELNFVHEARHARIFTKYTKKAKIDYVSAPYTYPELSSHDVLTAELIQGIPMTDIITAVEQENTEALRRLEALDIDPVRLAKRFLRLSHFNLFENVLFHADPHPANVLVRPHDHIVLIDFGSCGAYTHKERHKWRQLALCHLTDDVSGMVQAGLSILEPIPAIDIDEFTKKMEKVFWKDLYAFEDPHSEWWEHTSANIWLSFLSMARDYNLTINLNTLRMIRATLLYDTVAARLFKDIDAYKEYFKYSKGAGKRIRKRYTKTYRKFMKDGLDPRAYIRFEQFEGIANRILYLTQRVVDIPFFAPSFGISKLAHAINQALEALVALAILLSLGTLGYQVWDTLRYTIEDLTRTWNNSAFGLEALGPALFAALSHGWEHSPTLLESLWDWTTSPVFIAFTIIIVMLRQRAALWRMADKQRTT